MAASTSLDDMTAAFLESCSWATLIIKRALPYQPSKHFRSSLHMINALLILFLDKQKKYDKEKNSQ